MPSYALHGLRVHSPLPIAGLPSCRRDAPVDVVLRFGSLPGRVREPGASTPFWSGDRAGPSDDPLLQVRRVTATGELWVHYSDGTEFLIDSSGERVLATWAPPLGFEDAIVYLLGPVVGILLRIRERTCLHASVIAIGEEALAFVGPAGRGKSTTAAAFVEAGYRVLSDDLLALEERAGRPWAEPGYSRLRLWPASVEGLRGRADALPPIVAGWEKRYLDLAAQSAFCASSLPVGGIYVIGDRVRSPAPLFAPLRGRSALIPLLANAYAGQLPGAAERRRDFERLGRLAATVPVREIRIPDDWKYLRGLPAAVVADHAPAAAAAAG